MPNKRKNIFIIHTPFQLFVTEHMVAHLEEFKQSENILLIELPERIDTCDILWSSIYFLENTGGSVIVKGNYLKSERNMSLIYDLIAGDNVQIFLSDIQWPMNNRVFYDNYVKSKAVFNLFIDGVASYLGLRINYKLFCRNMVKNILGNLGLGVQYHFFRGNELGEDHPRISGVYGFCSDLLACAPHKRRNIPVVTSKQEIFADGCIFLDQPYWKFIGDKKWGNIRTKTLDFLLSLGYDNLYYKNHPMGRKADEDFYHQKGVKIVDDVRCIEQIFTERGFQTVVSYNSSALFNLKISFGDNIRCISIMHETMAKSYTLQSGADITIKKLFLNAGVEVLDDN
jgi:hypothetical protein